MSNPSLTLLRKAALMENMLAKGDRDISGLPVERYSVVYREMSKTIGRVNPDCPIDHNAAQIIGRSLLTGRPLSCVSFICVSDYIGNTRFKQQAGSFAPTAGERAMFKRASDLRQACTQAGVTLDWRLMLADGWGAYLYGDRVADGSLDMYCRFMEQECARQGFTALRWTRFMAQHRDAYEEARMAAADQARELAPWEAKKGEIAHDKPAKARALEIAHEHILMRAAEGWAISQVFGPIIVLSTEGRKLTRYDNLVAGKDVYPIVYNMPFWPHRL